MKFNVEIKESKVKVFWENINADFYKVFCKINGEFIEYVRIYNNTFATLSLLPQGRNECYVQAFKDGVLKDESSKKSFRTESVDVVCFLEGEDNLKIICNEYKSAKGYRLYKSENGEGFNGVKNFHSTEFSIENKPDCRYKIKPFSVQNNERIVISSSRIFSAGDCEFKKTTLYKSIGSKAFLSWNFKGYADGFIVSDKNSQEIVEETNDGLKHYAYVDLDENSEYVIRAFVNSPNGKIVICESEQVKLTERKFEKPRVSLIIPAYNSKDYIARSIDSALASDFDDLEIIIVNDGSTDETQDVIDWYDKNYPNVVSIKKENGGVADSRNKGIEISKGEFIAFLDNDDLIRPDMISTLYKSIVKNDCDIVVSPLYRIVDKGYTTHCNLPFEPDTAYDIDNYLEIMYTPGFYNCAIWNKLYRASIVKAHPLGLLKYEDVSWTPCILSWVKTFCFIDKPFYEWDRKTRPETFGDVLAKMPEDFLFENRKQAMLFFINNGNPEKLHYMKTIAKRRLLRYSKSTESNFYMDLIKKIEA